VWEICSLHFDKYAPRPAIGRGDGLAREVYKVGLSLDPDGVPYAEHANIVGWDDKPGVPDNELKHHWMAKAQKMAPHFRYVERQNREG